MKKSFEAVKNRKFFHSSLNQPFLLTKEFKKMRTEWKVKVSLNISIESQRSWNSFDATKVWRCFGERLGETVILAFYLAP